MLSTKKTQTWIPGILNDFLGNEWVSKMNGSTVPAINIMECDKRYRVEIVTPGITRDDLNIELKNDNHLIVTIEKDCCKPKTKPEPKQEDKESEQTQTTEVKVNDTEAAYDAHHKKASCSWEQDTMEDRRHGKYIRREFTYSHFRQTLILPDNVEKSAITAKQENGILTILIPKKDSYIEANATKKIAVE